MISWIDKRSMPNLEYDFTMKVRRNDKGKVKASDKYKLTLYIRHGIEERITSNG